MTTTLPAPAPVRIQAHGSVTKRLGNWTTACAFEVHAHRGHAVLDLRSPRIPAGGIDVAVDLDHAMLKLLVPDDAVVDDWNLRRIGRGNVKDRERPEDATGRRITVTGEIRHGEIRVHRGGMAVLSAMFSRAFLADLRHAREHGEMPTVADPSRTA